MSAYPIFLKYSIGLDKLVNDRLLLVKVEANQISDDAIELSLVSGENLSRIPFVAKSRVSLDEWEGREIDYYGSRDSKWMFEKVGLSFSN